MEQFKRNIYVENSSQFDLYNKLSYFQDYTFIDTSHEYFYKGQKVDVSVTEFVDKFIEPFDEAKWLPKKAKERGISESVLKEEWKQKAEISSTTGTLFHKYMEQRISGKLFIPDFNQQAISKDIETRYTSLTPIGNKFVEDTRGYLVPVKGEFIVGYSTQIAGQIDQIFYNKNTNKLELYDWKTNKAINTSNPWKKYMKQPFTSLCECELNTYSLQLSVYKYLLNLQGISIGDMYIVWINEHNDTYKLFKCDDLTAYVRSLIK